MTAGVGAGVKVGAGVGESLVSVTVGLGAGGVGVAVVAASLVHAAASRLSTSRPAAEAAERVRRRFTGSPESCGRRTVQRSGGREAEDGVVGVGRELVPVPGDSAAGDLPVLGDDAGAFLDRQLSGGVVAALALEAELAPAGLA